MSFSLVSEHLSSLTEFYNSIDEVHLFFVLKPTILVNTFRLPLVKMFVKTDIDILTFNVE